MARSTKRVCRDCGFFLPLAGSLGAMFGVCGNQLSADGQVVDKQYGCGAHSDTPAPAGTGSPIYEPYDDGVLDVVEAPTEVAEEPGPAEVEPAAAAEATEPDVRPQLEPEAEASTPETPEAQPEALEAQPEQAEQPEVSEAQPEQAEPD